MVDFLGLVAAQRRQFRKISFKCRET